MEGGGGGRNRNSKGQEQESEHRPARSGQVQGVTFVSHLARDCLPRISFLTSPPPSPPTNPPPAQRAHRDFSFNPSPFPSLPLFSMPSVRLPLMETSENTATPSPTPAATARRSGRERRAPEKFRPEAPIAPKRKRGDDDDDDAENQQPAVEGEGDDDEAMSDGNDDDDAEGDSPDEEEERAARRQKKRNGASRTRKPPAAKKPKTNGTAPAQSMSIPSRPKAAKKTARVVTGDRRDGDGVYGEDQSRSTREKEELIC